MAENKNQPHFYSILIVINCCRVQVKGVLIIETLGSFHDDEEFFTRALPVRA